MQNRGLAILFKYMSRFFFGNGLLSYFHWGESRRLQCPLSAKLGCPLTLYWAIFLWISKRRAHTRLSCHFENRNVILFSDMNWQKIASFLLIWARFCDHDKILPIKRNRRNEMNDREQNKATFYPLFSRSKLVIKNVVEMKILDYLSLVSKLLIGFLTLFSLGHAWILHSNSCT